MSAGVIWEWAFVVAIDKREKAPFSFTGHHHVSPVGVVPTAIRTEQAQLETGDYSIVGHEGKIAVERKSLADLWGTLSGAARRRRFEAELERMADMWLSGPTSRPTDDDASPAFACSHVIVEASWDDVLGNGPQRSRMPAVAIANLVQRWQQQFPSVKWCFCPSRRQAETAAWVVLHGTGEIIRALRGQP